jgi:hypothetical protein
MEIALWILLSIVRGQVELVQHVRERSVERSVKPNKTPGIPFGI